MPHHMQNIYKMSQRNGNNFLQWLILQFPHLAPTSVDIIASVQNLIYMEFFHPQTIE